MTMPGFIGKCLLLAPLLLPALATAAQYKGYLIPGNYATPTAVVLKLKFEADKVIGIVSATTLRPMDGRVSGNNNSGYCNLTLIFDAETKANLQGRCGPESFDGEYRLYYRDRKIQAGMFNLKQEKAEKAEKSAKSQDDFAPRLSLAACIKRNAACLSACPRGDYNTEFLCANTCRRKKLACQGKATAAARDAALAPAAEETQEDDKP